MKIRERKPTVLVEERLAVHVETIKSTAVILLPATDIFLWAIGIFSSPKPSTCSLSSVSPLLKALLHPPKALGQARSGFSPGSTNAREAVDLLLNRHESFGKRGLVLLRQPVGEFARKKAVRLGRGSCLL